MTADLAAARWVKSSASSVDGCVEVAHLPGGLVAVRDSKDVATPAHVLTASAWAAFLTSARAGEFDPPGA